MLMSKIGSLGSAACAIRDAIAGARVRRVGYEFQYFTSPDYRRRGVARSLRERIESHLSDQGAALSYALIMEGNVPSMRLFEREGFHLHRKLVMPAIAVIKEVQVPGAENIRSITPRDLEAVAELLNQTWHLPPVGQRLSSAVGRAMEAIKMATG